MGKQQKTAAARRTGNRDEFAAFTDKQLIKAYEKTVNVFDLTGRNAMLAIFRLYGITPEIIEKTLKTGEYNYGPGNQMFDGLGTMSARVITI